MAKSLLFPKHGESALLEYPPNQRLKFGVVNVNVKDVKEELDSALMVQFHPVNISGRNDSLNKIVHKDIAFTSIKGHINVDIEENNHMSLSILMQNIPEENKVVMLNQLATQCYNSVIAFYGIGDPQIRSELLERHKELTDKEYIKKLILLLLPYNESQVDSQWVKCYTDELLFKLPKENKGFHGSIDMMAGSILFSNEDVHLPGIIVQHKSQKLAIKVPHYVEAKVQSGVPQNFKKIQPLSSGASVGSSDGSSGEAYESLTNGTLRDIKTAAQPVAVTLAVSQVQTSEPVILFYMNRKLFRPFVYFKTGDIMLTTADAYEWNDGKKLNIRGVLLMTLLMGEVLPFKNQGMLGKSLYEWGAKRTGFIGAIGEQNPYKEAILLSEEVKLHGDRVGASPFRGSIPPAQKQADARLEQIIERNLIISD